MPTPSPIPLFLAPMAGVTDAVFRQICKRFGADILTTEFVSADGILHRNERTSDFLEFDPIIERPLGVQLFGANPLKLAEAAKAVLDWKQPDFIDLNFGCPVNKVVAKNGGSSLLKDCPLLEQVASGVVNAVQSHAAHVPVTAKIRIGWDDKTINAPRVASILENVGIQRLAVHGRTKAQGYSGFANWNVIGEVANSVKIPVIGNGDITNAHEAILRMTSTNVSGLMIGRGAMGNPWIFQEIKTFLSTGEIPPKPSPTTCWNLIIEHCKEVIARRRRGGERAAVSSMRSRFMAYTRGMDGSRQLRGKLAHVSSLTELEDLAAMHLAQVPNPTSHETTEIMALQS